MKKLLFLAFFFTLAPLVATGGVSCSNKDLRGYIAGTIRVSESGVRSIHFNGANMTDTYVDRQSANKDNRTTKHGGSGGDASDLKIYVTEDFLASSNVTLNIIARTEPGSSSDKYYYWLPDLCDSGGVGYEKLAHLMVRVPKSDVVKITANGGNGTDGYISRDGIPGHGGDAGRGGYIEVYYDNVDLIKNLKFEVYPGQPGKGSEGVLTNFYRSGADGKNGIKGLVLLAPVTKKDLAIGLKEELNLIYPFGPPNINQKTIKFMDIEKNVKLEEE